MSRREFSAASNGDPSDRVDCRVEWFVRRSEGEALVDPFRVGMVVFGAFRGWRRKADFTPRLLTVRPSASSEGRAELAAERSRIAVAIGKAGKMPALQRAVGRRGLRGVGIGVWRLTSWACVRCLVSAP